MLFPFSSGEVRQNYLAADQYAHLCDRIFARDTRLAQGRQTTYVGGDLIYAQTDEVPKIFERLRLSRRRVVLVTAESDRSADAGLLSWMPPQVTHWFSTNAVKNDPRLIGLPLGLGNSYCQVTLQPESLAKGAGPNETRTKWLYVNFREETNLKVRGPIKGRFRNLGAQPWFTLREQTISIPEFQTEMSEHRFILCPPGNGIDTHRMWEALYSRTIPVVQRSMLMDLCQGLPILFVDDFSEVTPELLEREYARISKTEWNYERLFLPWWREQLLVKRTVLREGGAKMGFGAFAAASANYVVDMLRRRL